MRYNILYAKLDASQQDLDQAVQVAHLYEFFQKLPNGYDTIVGERGVKLSGGEKQRVAIARLFLKNTPLYIFDEATSALDNTTEKAIQQNLREISVNKTTLIIAHRLSTITHADTIIVLNQGSIIEQGTHEELLTNKGLYRTLWNAQQ